MKNLKSLNIKQLLDQNRLMVVGGFLLICIIFADYKIFLHPMVSKMAAISPQVKEKQSRLDNAQRIVVNISNYEKQITDLTNKLSPHNKRFSTKQQISALLESLSMMANSSGVKITAVVPHTVVSQAKENTTDGGYQKFPISIRAIGGYHQLGVFANKLENADTFMRVADIKVESSSRSTLEHDISIFVNTYVLTEGT